MNESKCKAFDYLQKLVTADSRQLAVALLELVSSDNFVTHCVCRTVQLIEPINLVHHVVSEILQQSISYRVRPSSVTLFIDH